MIVFAMGLVLLFTAVLFILLIRAKHGLMRLLFISLISALIVAQTALYAVYTQESMYLDIAIAFALLSFMDVQFYAVYLRRKGELT